jgi:serine protease Do
VIEDIKILEAVERYISGQMSPDERVYFEQLRKSNPEIDQMVVEHTFFLQQMNRFDDVKKFKSILNDTHIHLGEKGLIKAPRLKGKARVIYLYNRYKRVSAIAASIAGITALTISALVWSLSPVKPNSEYKILKGELENIKDHNRQQDRVINQISTNQNHTDTKTREQDIDYKTSGTGFLIDTKGYVVTNAHVVGKAQHIALQNSDGQELNVKLVYIDEAKDIAILKIDDNKFRSPSLIPYAIKKVSPDIAETIYTLGFPRYDIVYGEGYLAAKTGYKGDTLSCQISLAANPGNSGSPILNKNGEVIGILTGKQSTAEGAVFAVRSKYILEALNALQKDSSYKNIKVPTTSTLKGKDRTQQVKTISDYVFMVKVD